MPSPLHQISVCAQLSPPNGINLSPHNTKNSTRTRELKTILEKICVPNMLFEHIRIQDILTPYATTEVGENKSRQARYIWAPMRPSDTNVEKQKQTNNGKIDPLSYPCHRTQWN